MFVIFFHQSIKVLAHPSPPPLCLPFIFTTIWNVQIVNYDGTLFSRNLYFVFGNSWIWNAIIHTWIGWSWGRIWCRLLIPCSCPPIALRWRTRNTLPHLWTSTSETYSLNTFSILYRFCLFVFVCRAIETNELHCEWVDWVFVPEVIRTQKFGPTFWKSENWFARTSNPVARQRSVVAVHEQIWLFTCHISWGARESLWHPFRGPYVSKNVLDHGRIALAL